VRSEAQPRRHRKIAANAEQRIGHPVGMT
jgi:hypothetical protein